MSDRSITHRLIRVSDGSDTVYAAGATSPDGAGEIGFSAVSVANMGGNSHVEVCVVAVDASGVVQARGSCAFDLRFSTVVDRAADARIQNDGSSWLPFCADSIPVTGVALQQWTRVPFNGGKLFIGMENLASAPGGAAEYQIWAKAVCE
jgi:hypothetical protein